MPKAKSAILTIDRRMILSSLWIFAIFNYLYADVISLMDPAIRATYEAGAAGFMKITPTLLFFGALLMETAMLMVVLPRILPWKINRVANIIAGCLHTVALLGSLFVGSTPEPYYLLCAAFEVPATILIVILAAKWKQEASRD